MVKMLVLVVQIAALVLGTKMCWHNENAQIVFEKSLIPTGRREGPNGQTIVFPEEKWGQGNQKVSALKLQ